MKLISLDMDAIQEAAHDVFPDPLESDPDGFVARGGELSSEFLLMAYSIGVFPWFTEKDPILWWSPDPRMVFYPIGMKMTRSLEKTISSGCFEVQFDSCFKEVIRYCASIHRKGEKGTWITPGMQKAYIALHEKGFAHSVETFQEGKLVGGLYGISMGKVFFGESMFHIETDASKVAFHALTVRLKEWNFDLIDGQLPNPHLERLGGKQVERKIFMELLSSALRQETRLGTWRNK
jgi:leucyl/phenylalanyl-tRNA---protein transferase